MAKRKIKIAFDLDGVIIDKPPFIPKWLIEWLVRAKIDRELSYRFPKSKTEQFIRWLSHMSIFRPPIKKNLDLIKKLAKNKNVKLYIISSRYSFLKERTYQWLKKHKIDGLFYGIHLNLKNEQPHIFKEKMIKKLNIDIFIDDDFLLVNYLRKKNLSCRVFCFSSIERGEEKDKIFNLSLIFNL